MQADRISVIGVVATYRRPLMLRDLLQSISDSKLLTQVVVVDNGFQEEAAEVCRQARIRVVYHRPERNLGCGGGVGRGLQLGLKEETATHFCLFDDDARATPGSIDSLIRGMNALSAAVAVPLVLNERGVVSWHPGLQQRLAWDTIRRPDLTAEEYRRVCGTSPVPFSWSPWPVMAVSAQAVRDCGYPRDDFWLCAEDLEFSLRLTYRNLGVLVPEAVCCHLPPPTSGGEDPGGAHYLRFCLLLQNLSYITTRLPHARRAFRHLPGNFLRFFRTFGFNWPTIRDASLACWRGTLIGKPAGTPGCDGFRTRFLAYYAAKLPHPA
jgi:GT2 family glycosyltransferase